MLLKVELSTKTDIFFGHFCFAMRKSLALLCNYYHAINSGISKASGDISVASTVPLKTWIAKRRGREKGESKPSRGEKSQLLKK